MQGHLDSVDSTAWLSWVMFGPHNNLHLLKDSDPELLRMICSESLDALMQSASAEGLYEVLQVLIAHGFAGVPVETLRQLGRLLMERQAQRSTRIHLPQRLSLFDAEELSA
jgi:hypothetical protein